MSARRHKIASGAAVIISSTAVLGGFGGTAASAAVDPSPFGNFESAVGAVGAVEVRGWAIDPDTTDPVYVWVTVDGVGRHVYADRARSDLGAAFPEYGSAHAFTATIPVEPGTRRVCATAANVDAGIHKLLTCKVVTVDVPAGDVAGSDISSGRARPGSTNTGVPAGVRLTRHDGDIVVTTPGTVLDSLDIHGTVSVRADDVVIRNSRIRGKSTTYETPLVSMNRGFRNLVIRDSEIAPDNPSPYLYGVMGWEFTLERVDIHHVVDSAHIYGPNVTISSSWLHDNVHYDNDPNFGGTPTHDDGVQIQRGSNIRIVGSRIEGAYNAAIQITQDQGVTRDVQITGNWLDGGGCTVNVADKTHGQLLDILVVGNTFGRSTRLLDCAVIAPAGADGITARDNVYVDGEAAATRSGD